MLFCFSIVNREAAHPGLAVVDGRAKPEGAEGIDADTTDHQRPAVRDGAGL